MVNLCQKFSHFYDYLTFDYSLHMKVFVFTENEIDRARSEVGFIVESVMKDSVMLYIVEEKDKRAQGGDSDSWTSCS